MVPRMSKLRGKCRYFPTSCRFHGLAPWILLLVGCGSDVSLTEQKPDPVVEDFPLAYIERPLPRDDEGNLIEDDLLRADLFMPGARLMLKSRALPGAEVRNLTDRLWPADTEYDVKDLTVSYDGQKLLFAMRAPAIEDADDDEQPSWNI